MAIAAGAVPASYQMLQPAPVIAISVAAALVATGVLAALARWTRRPLRTFRIIAVVALVLSFGGPLRAGAGMMQGGAVGGATVATMLVMHVVAVAPGSRSVRRSTRVIVDARRSHAVHSPSAARPWPPFGRRCTVRPAREPDQARTSPRPP